MSAISGAPPPPRRARDDGDGGDANVMTLARDYGDKRAGSMNFGILRNAFFDADDSNFGGGEQ
jgi:hypothetical protein